MIVVKTLAAITGVAFGAVAPELPAVGDVLSRARSAAVEASSLVGVGEALPAARTASCPIPQLNGAKIEGRFLSSTKDVKAATGEDVGTIESEGRSWFFKDKSGYIIAKSSSKQVEGGRKITVTDCSNQLIGEIIESERDDGAVYGWHLALKDASGKTVALTLKRNDRWTDEYVLMGPDDAVVAKITGDDGDINIMAPVDQRLIIMTTMANRDAGYEAANRHRRDNPREPGGRHL